ncbi:hypothetical protein QO058_06370 [Bosea vestrisii]|uniref:hypothetical protein n=1 Tax=Bosea vestrisii TaxID=151416 RepID=UPI0024DFF9CA|nr:hypothetical protein [Bosea vestrisii]WID97871.1 hypothetical protein QO058_06370 [Bosea vestrisii]
MTRFFKSLLPFLLALPLLSGNARAQVPADLPCADRNLATTQLRELYGERRIGYGLAANGSVIELFRRSERLLHPVRDLAVWRELPDRHRAVLGAAA